MKCRVLSAARRLLTVILLSAAFGVAAPKTAEPNWIRISSAHYSILTDAGEKRGREVAVRFEQMRVVFAQLLMRTRVRMPEPLEIIALKNGDEYANVAPPDAGKSGGPAGFFLPGEDRNYFVLNLTADESWRSVSREYALLLLNYNYPPTQLWFDQGFAAYFSSLRLDGKLAEIGSDPDASPPSRESLIPNPPKAPQSLVELLKASPWCSLPDFFRLTRDPAVLGPVPSAWFQAQSWIVVHYLINHDKLGETGAYFDLVQNQKLPVETAIQQGYGMSPAVLAQAVNDYFQSQVARQTANSFPVPVDADVIGTSRQEIPDANGEALLAEMEVRIPERRGQAIQELNAMVNQPKTDNAIAHRALAWVRMEQGDSTQALDELIRASALDRKDPWVRYYAALVRYRAAQAGGGHFQGVANMMLDLKAVIEWYPDFAAAYDMLALAQLEGGGAHAALDSIRVAVPLSPRSENYVLDMAHIYIAGKKWDEATVLLERLKDSRNVTIARGASKELDDLPTLRRYGVVAPAPAPPVSSPGPQTAASTGSAEDEDEPPAPAEPQPDKRPVQFLKGKLLSVDCSQTPMAVVTVTSKAKRLQLRTEDYKALVLIGADTFSCGWKDLPVAINYKPGGKSDGDLVSLELQ